MIDPDKREGEAVQLLLSWTSKLPGVLIGGYAVAGYGQPRYSEDLDIVAPSSAEHEWARWLRSNRLALERSYGATQAHGPVAAQRWHRGPVYVDLMSGGVRDRDSGVVIPEDWLLRSPRPMRLELLSGRVESPVAVVRLEGLWATKLVAGRGQDIADLFTVSLLEVALDEIRDLFARLETPALRHKFDELLIALHRPRTYADALSRLKMGSPALPVNVRRWSRFTKMVNAAIAFRA